MGLRGCLSNPRVQTAIERLVELLARVGDDADGTGTASASRPPSPRPPHKLAHRLDEEAVARLVADYGGGAPVQALVQSYKISKTSVLAILHAHDVPIRFPGRPDDETLQRATELYEAGLSLLRVSQQVDVPDETLRRHLRERGVVIRRRGRPQSTPLAAAT